MAAKKYLSLDEAAQFLGVRPDEVIRLRERGELRGFADRGTWKFKSDDVEEAKRRRQPDSNPDVPIIGEDTEVMQPIKVGSKSDSDVRLVTQESLRKSLTGSSHDLPTVKSGKGSDSDVRLVGSAPPKGSDSDVKLIKPKDSDSDVKLSDSDSDVRLAGRPMRGLHDSDSDVRLALPEGSDSDVKLIQDDETGGVTNTAMTDPFDFDTTDSVLDADSGVGGAQPESGIRITGDSGVRLTGDSGLRLGGDSGIQLSSPADSGILLEGKDSGFRLGEDDSPVFKLAGDSGLKFSDSGPKVGKSGPKLKQPAEALSDEDIDSATPMLFAGEDESRTDPDVPMLMDEEDDVPIPGLGDMDRTNAETSVIVFDEEDPDATVIRKKSGRGDQETSEFDADADLEVDEEELLDDDGDLDEMEVFESEDSDFDESFSEGASAAEISAFRGKIAVPVDQEWGTLAVAGLGLSTIAMTIGVIVAVDLLRNVWGAGSGVYPGELVGTLGGFFK